ncbi:MAG: hypothetical protein ACE5JG_13460, partial [Planctomycetota bacterium]
VEAIHLARKKDPKALPLLRRALKHPDPFFRAAAAQYLRDPAGLLQDPVPEVRLAAVNAARMSQDAEAHLRSALTDPEPVIRAAAFLGLVARAEPASAKFRPELEVAVRQDRQLTVGHLILGVWRIRRGEAELALRSFQGAAVFQPGHLDVWLGLADAYAALGRDESARQARGRCGELLARALSATPPAGPDLVDRVISAYIQAKRHDEVRALLRMLLDRLEPGPVRRHIRKLQARFLRRYGEGS